VASKQALEKSARQRAELSEQSERRRFDARTARWRARVTISESKAIRELSRRGRSKKSQG
jgi:hypothetical protein